MPQWQAKRARHIISVSQSTVRDLFRSYGVPQDKVTVIHSGVDSELTRPAQSVVEEYRTLHGLPQEYILALGTLEPRKNLDALIDAFDLLAHTTSLDLVFAGPPGWRSHELLHRISQSPHRQRIHVVGPVPQRERSLLLSASRVLAYPSYLEGFGFPPLEALACEVPVVASHNSSIAEVVGEWAVLVGPYNPRALASALQYAAYNAAIRERIRHASAQIHTRYSWNTTAQRTLEVLTRSVVY
jgi:glycosyltransferase involved in cell wall biosynthesis